MLINSEIKVIWFDPSISNDENRRYCENWMRQNYYLSAHSKLDETVDMINTLLESEVKLIIISSGKSGRAFIQKINHLQEKVLGVIIFCSNVAFHSEWTKDYPMIKSVCDTYDKVMDNFKKIANHSFEKVFLEKFQTKYENSTSEDASDRAFFHCSFKRVLNFQIYKIYDRAYVSEETDMKYAISEFADESVKQTVLNDFEKKQDNILKAICYVYTTNYIYKPFNEACATGKFYNVIRIINTILKELKRQPEKMFVPNNSDLLYRGVKRNRIKSEDYQENAFGYFSAFTSASKSKELAISWATSNGVVFVIELDTSDPHPNVILKDDWTAYPGEEEVLLLPLFSLQITKREKIGEQDWIYVKQNITDSVLTMNPSKYWNENIRKEMRKIASQERMEYKNALLFDWFEYFASKDFKTTFFNKLGEQYFDMFRFMVDIIMNEYWKRAKELQKFFGSSFISVEKIFIFQLREPLSHLKFMFYKTRDTLQELRNFRDLPFICETEEITSIWTAFQVELSESHGQIDEIMKKIEDLLDDRGELAEYLYRNCFQ